MDIPIASMLAAIPGWVSICWQLWNYFMRDVGRLNVQVRILDWSGPERPQLNPFELTITNIGRRPIGLDSWYVRFKDGTERKMIQPRLGYKLPTKLGEQDRFEDPWFLKDIPGYSNLDTVFAVDATGKKWEISKQTREAILEYLKRMPKAGP